jgi:hypothetical protein
MRPVWHRRIRTTKISQVAVELLERRQLLTDPLHAAVDGFDAELLAGLATMEAKIRDIFQSKSEVIIGNFGSQIDSLFDKVFTVPAVEGSGADLDSQIDDDLHDKKDDVRTSATGIGSAVLSLLENMSRPAGYNWGISMDPDTGGPRYFYWQSDTMWLTADAQTGYHSAGITQTWVNSNPESGIVEDSYTMSGDYSLNYNGVSFGFTGERVKRNSDNSYADNWLAQFSLVPNEEPSFEINRVFSNSTVTFTQHLTVNQGNVTGVQLATTYTTAQLNVALGYHKDAAEERTGSISYIVNDHLEFSAMYKQLDVGTLFQSGLVYRYDDDNWVRGYLGKKDFVDPEIEDLYVAGLEFSLLTDNTITHYYNGTRSQVNSQISNQISRTFLPRGSKTFLQLRFELDTELNGLRDLLNGWGGEVGIGLSY